LDTDIPVSKSGIGIFFRGEAIDSGRGVGNHEKYPIYHGLAGAHIRE